MTKPKKTSSAEITEANEAVSRGGGGDQERTTGPRIGQLAAGMALAAEADAGKGETERALDRATAKDEARKR